MSGIKQALRRLNRLQKVASSFTPLKDGPVKGSFNKVAFATLKDVKLVTPAINARIEVKNSSDDLKIAISTRHRHSLANGNALLRKKNFHSAFVHTPLYSSETVQVFQMADGKDLSRYLQKIACLPKSNRAIKQQFQNIEKQINFYCDHYTPDLVVRHFEKITLEQVKMMFAQVVLGVEDLHNAGLVHLDLKSFNILVLNTDKGIHLKICDLDGVHEVNKKGEPVEPITQIAVTYVHPALPPTRELKQLKQLDGFALWTILYQIYSLSSHDKTGAANKLIKHLYNTDCLKPFDIKTIKNHPFFGETPKEREKLFSKLRTNFKTDLSIDSYTTTIPEEEDAFLLLPTRLKPLYHACEQLDNQLDHLENFTQADKMSVEQYHSDYSHIVGAIDKKIKSIKEQITNLPSVTSFQKEVKELKLQLEIQEKKMQLHQWSRAQMQKCEMIQPQQLKNAVDEAVKAYIEVNRLEQPKCFLYSLFSVHGEKGKLRAKKLQGQVNGALQLGTKSVFDLIKQFLDSSDGGSFKHSFKVILLQKLMAISELAVDEWSTHLSSAPIQPRL